MILMVSSSTVSRAPLDDLNGLFPTVCFILMISTVCRRLDVFNGQWLLCQRHELLCMFGFMIIFARFDDQYSTLSVSQVRHFQYHGMKLKKSPMPGGW